MHTTNLQVGHQFPVLTLTTKWVTCSPINWALKRWAPPHRFLESFTCYILILFCFFFLWWSPKRSQLFGGTVFTVFTSQQTLPEVCSEQDEMDFLMEALIIRYSLRFLYWWWAGGERVMQVIRVIYPLAWVQKRNPALFFTRWHFSSIWVTGFGYLFLSR